MRILIVEDEKPFAYILKKGLEEEGYAVDVAYNGEDGLFMAANEPSDVIILDIMLPGVDGMTILKTIRRAGVKTPVMMLTAMDTLADKVTGLDGGADEYMTKPVLFEELLARIRALLRRASDTKTSVIEIDGLSIDMATHGVKIDGKDVALSAKEYALLEYMALNRNRVLTRISLSEHLYGHDFDLDSNIIDVFINRLRNKLESGSGRRLIHTMRGAGYVLKG